MSHMPTRAPFEVNKNALNANNDLLQFTFSKTLSYDDIAKKGF